MEKREIGWKTGEKDRKRGKNRKKEIVWKKREKMEKGWGKSENIGEIMEEMEKEGNREKERKKVGKGGRGKKRKRKKNRERGKTLIIKREILW